MVSLRTTLHSRGNRHGAITLRPRDGRLPVVPFLLGCCLLGGVMAALAQEEDDKKLTWEDSLTGDWGGLRSTLAERGITFQVTETLEGWGNLAGGLRRGATINGLGKAQMTLDLERLIEWPGAK